MKKNIIVLGAGFGGLRATLQLEKKLSRLGLLDEYQIVLIDQHDHHTYTPLLYEVATATKNTANFSRLHELSAYRVRDILKHKSILFLETKALKINITKKHIHLQNNSEIFFEYLVIALGSEPNFFDIKGLEEHSLTLKTFRDAIRLRESLWNLAYSDLQKIQIIIAGAGSTGIELAGEIKLLAPYFRKHKNHRLRVALVEAAPYILPGFDPKIVRYAQKRLVNLGVSIIPNHKIASLEAATMTLDNGEKFPYDLFIWTGGVKAAQILTESSLKTEGRGRVEVVGDMECLPQTKNLKLHSKIYGLGDAVCFYDPITKKPISGVARAAIAQANIVAHNITEDILAEHGVMKTFTPRTYIPMQYPYIIPIGGKYAITKIGPFVFSGFFAWVLKGFVELNYLLSIMPPFLALKIWFKGIRTFIANDRLG